MSESSWPSFLDYLDSDPDRAFTEFYRFAVISIRDPLPKPMRGLNEGEIDDLIEDIVYHCTKSEFGALKTYQNNSRPFAAWLHVVAYNKSMDYLRKLGRELKTVSYHSTDEDQGLENILPAAGASQEDITDARKVLNQVRQTINLMGDYCQLLLEMAADEFTPKEMVEALKYDKNQNKKLSDDLRHCRQKLRKLLNQSGIDIASVNLI